MTRWCKAGYVSLTDVCVPPSEDARERDILERIGVWVHNTVYTEMRPEDRTDGTLDLVRAAADEIERLRAALSARRTKEDA